MPLLSHDKYEVEYQFVDTSSASRTGLKTKTNVLIGWPVVIFAQAIDNTNHKRYGEIQRRFIITNPRMDVEKYQNAVDLIIEKNSIPDLVYQQKVVSDEDKDIAREIVLNIRDDLLSLLDATKPGKNNILVPFGHLLKKIISKNNTSQDMTFVNRLMHHIVLFANIHIKKRPYFEISPAFGSNSLRIPLALYSDFEEALYLVNNSAGGLKPYVLEWFHNVFLKLYDSKSSDPDSKVKNGELIFEQRKAVTTQELIAKSKEIMNRIFVTKHVLSEFIYPLSNLGYIDNLPSEIDKRAKLYFLVTDLEKEQFNIFLLSL